MKNKILLKIGTILSKHGLKGELKVKLYKSYSCLPGNSIYFENKNNLLGPFTVNYIYKYQNNWILKIIETQNIKFIPSLSGYSIGIEQQYLPENTYWIEDIIGCNVITIDNKTIGKIKDVIVTGANDVYVVNDDNENEILIPALKSIVKIVDIANKIIVIEPLPGLIDSDEN